MKLVRIVPLLMAAALAVAATPAFPQVKLRWAHVGVANAPQTMYADEVAKLVKERTNGRVEIQVFPNSQLGGVGELVDGRSHHPTRATPVRVEVDEDGERRLAQDAIERCVREEHRVVEAEWRGADAAFRAVGDATCGDAVPPSA